VQSQVWRERGKRLVDVHDVIIAFVDQSIDLGLVPQGKRCTNHSAADGDRNWSTTGNDIVSLVRIGFHRAWGQDIDLVASSRELISKARNVGRYAARVSKIVRGNQSDLDLLVPPVVIGSICIPGQRLRLI